MKPPTSITKGVRWLAVGLLGMALSAGAQQSVSTNAGWIALIMHPVKDTATLEILRAVLKEADPVVRERALEALASIRDPADAARVRSLLDNESEATRQQAAKSAASLGVSLTPVQRAVEKHLRPMPASPAVAADFLRNTNALLLARGLRSLDAGAAQRESAALVALLRRPEAVVQEEAMRAIQRGHITAAAAELIARMDDPDEGLRLAASEALAAMFDQLARPELTAAMVRRMELDPSSQVRRVAGLTLVALHDSSAQAALLRLLGHTRGVTRVSAAAAWGTWGDPALVGALHPLLEDPEDLVSRATAHALGQLRNPNSKAPLLAAFLARGPVVQERAAWALGELKSTEAVPALITRLPTTTDEALKVSLALALGKIGDKRALAPLRQVLQQILLANNLARAREAAFVALTAMGDKLAIQRAIQIVTTPVVPPAPGGGPTFDDDFVRLAGLRYLATLGDRAAGATLLAGLKDSVPRDMRPAVAETLSKLLGKSYQPVPDEDHRRFFVESHGLRITKPVPPPGAVLAP